MPVPLADLEIRPLGPSDAAQLAEFACGDADLDDFIRTDVARLQDENVVQTYLARRAASGRRVLGYVSLLADAITLETGEAPRLVRAFAAEVVIASRPKHAGNGARAGRGAAGLERLGKAALSSDPLRIVERDHRELARTNRHSGGGDLLGRPAHGERHRAGRDIHNPREAAGFLLRILKVVRFAPLVRHDCDLGRQRPRIGKTTDTVRDDDHDAAEPGGIERQTARRRQVREQVLPLVPNRPSRGPEGIRPP